MSKFIPNSFQVPNVFVDDVMADLTDEEVKAVALYYRYGGIPPHDILRKHGLTESVFMNSVEKIEG